jgi:hypothetical protein
VSQRQILENSIQLLNTLRGPAKLLYAGSAVGFPTRIENMIDPTTGAPGASWLPFGLTRGGINVNKTIDTAQRDDVDQILGAYNQDVTDRSYIISTQLAEVLGDSTQLGVAMEMGAPTIVIGSGATQVMRPLDDGDNVMTEYKLAASSRRALRARFWASSSDEPRSTAERRRSGSTRPIRRARLLSSGRTRTSPPPSRQAMPTAGSSRSPRDGRPAASLPT